MPTLLYKHVTDPNLKEAFDKFATAKGVPPEEVVAYEDKDGNPQLTTSYGKLGTLGMSALTGAPAAVAGLGGAAAGSVVPVAGTIAGGLAASTATQLATDKLLDKFAPETAARMEASREAHPRLSFVGNAASQLSTGAGIAGPGIRALLSKTGGDVAKEAVKKAAVKNILGQAAVGGGLEAGVELAQGRFDPGDIAIASAAGPLFSKTHRLGRPVEELGGRLGKSAAAKLGIKVDGVPDVASKPKEPTLKIERRLAEEYAKNPGMLPEQALSLIQSSGLPSADLVTSGEQALNLLSSLGQSKKELSAKLGRLQEGNKEQLELAARSNDPLAVKATVEQLGSSPEATTKGAPTAENSVLVQRALKEKAAEKALSEKVGQMQEPNKKQLELANKTIDNQARGAVTQGLGSAPEAAKAGAPTKETSVLAEKAALEQAAAQDPARAVAEANKFTTLAAKLRKFADMAADKTDKEDLRAAADNIEKQAVEGLAARQGNRPTPEQLSESAQSDKDLLEQLSEQGDPAGTDSPEAAYNAQAVPPKKATKRNKSLANQYQAAKVVSPEVIPGNAADPNMPANSEVAKNPPKKQTQPAVDEASKRLEMEEDAEARKEDAIAEAQEAAAAGMSAADKAKLAELSPLGTGTEEGDVVNTGIGIHKMKGSGKTGKTIVGSNEKTNLFVEHMDDPDVAEAVRMTNIIKWLQFAKNEKNPKALREAALVADKETSDPKEPHRVHRMMVEQAINDSVMGKIPLSKAMEKVAEKFRVGVLVPQQQKAMAVVERVRRERELGELGKRKPGEGTTADQPSFNRPPKA